MIGVSPPIKYRFRDHRSDSLSFMMKAQKEWAMNVDWGSMWEWEKSAWDTEMDC